jgi:hypothetical protein
MRLADMAESLLYAQKKNVLASDAVTPDTPVQYPDALPA